MVDALSINAVTNFVATISSYKTDLEDKLEKRIKVGPKILEFKRKSNSDCI